MVCLCSFNGEAEENGDYKVPTLNFFFDIIKIKIISIVTRCALITESPHGATKSCGSKWTLKTPTTITPTTTITLVSIAIIQG